MRILTTLSLIACSASLAFAQAPKPTTSRSCRILFLDAPDNARKSVFLNDGSNTQQVALPSLNMSDVYQLPSGDVTLKLCDAVPTDEKPVPVGSPSVAVPAAVTDCYLLISSDPKNTVLPLRCQIVNASPAGFRAGQTLWLNLTNYLVGGQFGSRPLNLKPISQTIVDAPREGGGSYPIKVGYEAVKGQKANLILSTEWLHNPGGRNVVFVMMLPNTKIPRIKGFADFRDAPKQSSGQ